MKLVITEEWLRRQLAKGDDSECGAGTGCLICTMERLQRTARELYGVACAVGGLTVDVLSVEPERVPALCCCTEQVTGDPLPPPSKVHDPIVPR